MSLVEKLKNKYCIKPYLAIPEIKVNVEIIYDETIDEETKNNIERCLKDIGIGIGIIKNVNSSINKVHIFKDNNILCIKLMNGKKYSFKGEYNIYALIWSIYSIASRNDWLPQDKDDYDVIFFGYNSTSQKIAASVLNEVQNRLTEMPNTESLLKNIAKEYAKRFIDERPMFNLQPITNNGRDYITSGGILRKKETAELDKISNELFSLNKEFSDEINDYCVFLRKANIKYKNAVERASEECFEKLQMFPSYRLKESLENARSTIVSSLNLKEKIKLARKSLQDGRQHKFKNVKPSDVQTLFASTTSLYDDVCQKKIWSCFIDDIVQSLISQIEGSATSALDKLRKSNIEIKEFCQIDPSNYNIQIKWMKNGEVDLQRISVQDENWTVNEIDTIQKAQGPEGFYIKKWFASETVSKMALEQGIMQLDPVFSLDSHLLCALYFKDNSEL